MPWLLVTRILARVVLDDVVGKDVESFGLGATPTSVDVGRDGDVV